MTTTMAVGAGPQADVGSEPGIDYETRNAELFARRGELLALLAESDDASPRTRVKRRRANRELATIDTELVRLNLPLVYSYVNRFRSRTSEALTLEYEAAGTAGLWAAIKTYVPSKGRFSSWAHMRIKREVTRAVRAAEFSNMNYGDFEARPRILAAVESAGGLANADLDKVAVAARVTRASVDAVVSAPKLSSMDAPTAPGGVDGDPLLGDVVFEEEADVADQVFTSTSISALERLVLPLLSARELLVLVRRFGLDGEDPASSAEVGRVLGVSREAARQLEMRTMAKLNHPIVLRKLLLHRS